MASSQVTDPNGKQWTVSLPVLPRVGGIKETYTHHRWNQPDVPLSPGSGVGIPFFGSIDNILIGFGVLFVLFIIFFFGWPIIKLFSDIWWVILLIVLGLVALIFMKRHMTVYATDGNQNYTWQVKGYFAATAQKQKIENDIRMGFPPFGNRQ